MFFAFPEDQLGRTCLVQHDIVTVCYCWTKYFTTYYYNNNIIIIIIIIIIITSDTGKSKL